MEKIILIVIISFSINSINLYAKSYENHTVDELYQLHIKNNATASMQLAKFYLIGKGIKQNLGEAFKFLNHAAENGNPNAQYLLATLKINLKQTKIFYWYLKAANQGHLKAQYNVAKMYYQGVGVNRNFKKALDFYKKAANQGHLEAQYSLASYYNILGFNSPENNKKAFFWYEKAAEQGHIDAQIILSYHYYYGFKNIKKYPKKALYWYKKSQQLDLENNIGIQLTQLYHSLKDFENSAILCFRQPASKNRIAQKILASPYISGQSIIQYFNKNNDYLALIYIKNTEIKVHFNKITIIEIEKQWHQLKKIYHYTLDKIHALSLNGSASATLFLALNYLPKKPAKSKFWMNKSAKQGGLIAKKLLNYFYLDGEIYKKIILLLKENH